MLLAKKRDDYTAVCLLDFSYVKQNFRLIETDLSKQQTPDDDPKATQQINFTGILDQAGNTTMFFILKEVKETILDFWTGGSKSIVNALYKFILIII